MDLSRLRQGWSRKLSGLDSLPVGTEDTANKSTDAKAGALPELPSLGALASQAAMSMDDLDEFLSRYHQQETGQQETGRERFPQGENPPIAAVPEMPTTDTSPVFVSETPARQPDLGEIPALPTSPLPEVSMPQARDKIISRAKNLTPPAAPLAPDLSDLRKTAPQFSKFSPEPDAGTHPTEAPGEIPEEIAAASEDTPSFTDEDLREALQPIIDPVVDQFLYTPSQGIHTFLEPMLRSTVRRAIAEQMDDASPFHDVSGWDKFAWKLRAMFSSRSYDDIVFDYTRRYQVEEVYLLRPHSRSLISYASHDPARHAKPDKIRGTVKKIASKESEHKSEETPWIKWRDTRNLMIRRGKHCILAAIVHGPSNAILRADLDYALRQAEERYGKALEEESDIHIQILQPLLEGCLLIQAPAIPN